MVFSMDENGDIAVIVDEFAKGRKKHGIKFGLFTNMKLKDTAMGERKLYSFMHRWRNATGYHRNPLVVGE